MLRGGYRRQVDESEPLMSSRGKYSTRPGWCGPFGLGLTLVAILGLAIAAVWIGGLALTRTTNLHDDYFMQGGLPTPVKRSNGNSSPQFSMDDFGNEGVPTKLDMIKEVLTQRTKKIFRQVRYKCSSYRAFGDQGTKQGFLPTHAAAVEAEVTRMLAPSPFLGTPTLPPPGSLIGDGIMGAYAIGQAGDDFYEHYAGSRSGFDYSPFPVSIVPPVPLLPMTSDTIMRMPGAARMTASLAALRSQSVYNGLPMDLSVASTVARLSGNTALLDQKVIKLFTPEISGVTQDVISTTNGSSIITVTLDRAHNLVSGDLVALSSYQDQVYTCPPWPTPCPLPDNTPVNVPVPTAVDIAGIPGSLFVGSYPVTIPDLKEPTTFTFNTFTCATSTVTDTLGSSGTVDLSTAASVDLLPRMSNFLDGDFAPGGPSVHTVSGSNVVTFSFSIPHGLTSGDFGLLVTPLGPGFPANVGGIPIEAEFQLMPKVFTRVSATSISMTATTTATSTDSSLIAGPTAWVRLSPPDSGPIKTTEGSTTVLITGKPCVQSPFDPGCIASAAKHGLDDGGAYIISGIAGAVDGIPSSDFNGLHVVTVLNEYDFTIEVATPATDGITWTGGALTVTSVTPSAQVGIASIDTVAGSSTVTVTTVAGHNFAGASIIITGLTGAIGGIPLSELEAPQQVVTPAQSMSNVFIFDTGTVADSTVSNFPAHFYWAKVEPGVLQSPPNNCDPVPLYYKEVPVRFPIKLSQMMDNSVGLPRSMEQIDCFNPGYNGLYFPDAEWYFETRIYHQLYMASGLGSIIDGIVGSQPSVVGISNKDWLFAQAAIPMVFEPGESAMFDSRAMDLVAGYIEVLDESSLVSRDAIAKSRDFQAWMKDELFTPMGLVDTFYYISNATGNPHQIPQAEYDDKVSRIADIYNRNAVWPFYLECNGPANIPETFRTWCNNFARGQYLSTAPKVTIFATDGLHSTPAEMHQIQLLIKRGGKLADGTQLISAHNMAWATSINSRNNATNAFLNSVGLVSNNAFSSGAYSANAPDNTKSSSTRSFSITYNRIEASHTIDIGHDMIAAVGTSRLFDFSQFTSSTMRKFQSHLNCVEPGTVDMHLVT